MPRGLLLPPHMCVLYHFFRIRFGPPLCTIRRVFPLCVFSLFRISSPSTSVRKHERDCPRLVSCVEPVQCRPSVSRWCVWCRAWMPTTTTNAQTSVPCTRAPCIASVAFVLRAATEHAASEEARRARPHRGRDRMGLKLPAALFALAISACRRHRCG